tara:strand:- start:314 stop:508 length:195 start_codon:yes stop_codon:yes gene_type:complete
MYLNIVNNLSPKNQNRKKVLSKIDEKESKSFDEIEANMPNDCNINCYNSIFYGQLTENWIKLTS